VGSVEQLLSGLSADVPLALRLNGQLLLGLVRIYRRKLDYLQQDCQAVLERVAGGGSSTAAAAAAAAVKRQRGGGSDDGGEMQDPTAEAAAALGAPGSKRAAAAAAGVSRRGGGTESGFGGSESDLGLGFDVDMEDAFDLADPTWGSQGFSDALQGFGSSQGLGSQGSAALKLGGGQSHHQQGLGSAAGFSSLGLGCGSEGFVDDEMFDDFGENAAAFDLTDLEVQALRTASTSAAAAVAAAAAAAAAAYSDDAGLGASWQDPTESGHVEQQQQQLSGDDNAGQDLSHEGEDKDGHAYDCKQQGSAGTAAAAAAAGESGRRGSSDSAEQQHSCHTPPLQPPTMSGAGEQQTSSDASQQQQTKQQQQQEAQSRRRKNAAAAAAAAAGDEKDGTDREQQQVPFPGLESSEAAGTAAAAAAAAAAKQKARRGKLRQLFGGLVPLQIDSDTRHNRVSGSLKSSLLRSNFLL
jgi:hypothetical protein